MNTISWEDFLQGKLLAIGDIAATIGVFDGVHVGHQKLIEEIARKSPLFETVIFTFRENPALVLNRNRFRGTIMSLDSRLEIFHRLGVGSTVLIDFSPNFSKLSGIDFLKKIIQNICLRYLAVGKNFTCGYRADTNSVSIRSVLSRQGIEVAILDPVTFENDPVSSTRIRESIINGELTRTNRMLGKNFVLEIPVNAQRKSKNGMTVSRKEVFQVLPNPGLYPVVLENPEQSIQSTIEITSSGLSWHQDETFRTDKIVFTGKP